MKPLPFDATHEEYKQQSMELLQAVKLRDKEALRFMHSYNLRLQKLGEENFFKHEFSRIDAEEAVLDWYHFRTWEGQRIFTNAVYDREEVREFEEAVEAIVAGDENKLRSLLQKNPGLVTARSIRWHGSQLIHYVGANGVEDFRQKTPPNSTEILKLLLDAGADVNATAGMYGGGSTTFGLVSTSIWPSKAGLMVPLLETLLKAGAHIGGEDGSAVTNCLANGRPESADALVRYGAKLNLEGAAGTGGLEVVRSYFNEDGSLKDEAHREQMEKGFMWACEFGQTAVIEFLLDKGFEIDKQVDGMAGLHWAVLGAHIDTVNLLIDRGASLENVNKYGGTVLGSALWAVIHSDPVYRWPSTKVDFPAIIEILLKAGAVVRQGVISWLQQTDEIPPERKQPIEELLKKYGAS
jgi:hypothetical protein